MAKIKTAKEIKAYLDEYVIAQDEAKKALSYALFMHNAKSLAALKNGRDKAYKNTAIMLIGSTGVGKTYLIETLARYADKDVHTINAKDLSGEGYVGLSLSDAFRGFVKQSGKDGAKKVENSIVFIDEFDKLCTEDTKNGFSLSLQQQLLKIIEGQKLTVSSRNDDVIDTSHILFILGGNFQHMRDMRNNKSGMGFAATAQSTNTKALHDELASAGMIRELAGRVSLVAELHDLTLAHMQQIVKAKDNVISQAIEVLDSLDIKHKLTKARIDKLIKQCIDNKTGARGLQTELDKYLIDIISDLDLDLDDKEYLEKDDNNVTVIQSNSKAVGFPVDFKYQDDNMTVSFSYYIPAFAVGQRWRTVSGLKVVIEEITDKFMRVRTLEGNASTVLNYEVDGRYPKVPELTLYCQIK